MTAQEGRKLHDHRSPAVISVRDRHRPLMRGSYRLGAVRADPATMVTRERTVPGRILLARDAGFGSGRLTVAP